MIDNNGCCWCFFVVSEERVAYAVGVETTKEITAIANIIEVRIE